MIANYHTHTWRCNHARGTERQYIENAIEGGIRILGFSDHTPCFFPHGHRSGFRMTPDQLDDYCETLLGLKREYASDIELHIGLEVEYYPELFDRLVRFCAERPIEYFILGQHFTGNEYDGVYSGSPTSEETVLAQYCEQVAAGAESGRFLYLAHPDLIHYTGDPAVYDRHIRNMCRRVRAAGIPVEFNFLGWSDKRHYPSPVFWRIAAEEKMDVVFGADAHAPDAVWNPEALKAGEAMIRDTQLNLLETLMLPGPGWLRQEEA